MKTNTSNRASLSITESCKIWTKAGRSDRLKTNNNNKRQTSKSKEIDWIVHDLLGFPVSARRVTMCPALPECPAAEPVLHCSRPGTDWSKSGRAGATTHAGGGDWLPWIPALFRGLHQSLSHRLSVFCECYSV